MQKHGSMRYGNVELGPSPLGSLQCIATLQQLSFEQSGENKAGGRYNYHKLGADLLNKVNPIAREHNCVLLFSTTHSSVSSGMEMVQGSKDVAPKPRLQTYAYCEVTTRVQSITDKDDWVEVTTYGFKVDQTSDKSSGAVTVARRYGIMALCSLAPDDTEDVDGPGNYTSTIFGGGGEQPKPQQPQQVAPAATSLNSFFQ